MSALNQTLSAQSSTAIPRAMTPSACRIGTEVFLPVEMHHERRMRIAFVGNYLPRQCGIATFTTDLCNAIAAESAGSDLMVVAVNDAHSSYAYPQRVQFTVNAEDLSSYRAAANFLNDSRVDVVCLQHEYGIFGGESGRHVLCFLQHLKMPVVTTLHTVLCKPDLDQQIILEEIAARSARLVVMSQHSAQFLQNVFRVPARKVALIPHGIPDMPFVDPDVSKEHFALTGKTVLLTFGLLSTNKGFENVIRALPRILATHPDVVYVIAGATHPHIRLKEGDRYRIGLQNLAAEMGVEQSVIFYNHFFTPQEMASLVAAADIYITPYCHEAQAVSGTLAFAMGAGKAVISTPYWHATELLDKGRGVLVPFEDEAAIADAINNLIENHAARMKMRQLAYLYGRDMLWSQVAHSYMRTFEDVSVVHSQRIS